jgi:Tol biopolymer transport system component
VTWRPDGRLLAAIAANNDSGNGAGASSAPTFTVSVYDTSTGKLVKQVTPNFTDMQVGSSSNQSLVWSPDGSRLLLVDNVYGAITIWGPGALPKPAGG